MSYARNAEITANTAHKDADGSSHTYIDQSVVSGSSPTFDGANITGVDAANVDIADGGALITATTVEGALAENRGLIDSAVQQAATDASSWGFVVDEDNMVSDLATKVPTQQSVKAYVDTEVAAAVTSEMSYKGAYNASTNTPDLDTSPTGVALGDVYAVTVAGTFFTTAVEAGDLLIANTASPTLEAHWDVVQANLTAASIKTQYESNSDTNAFTDAEQSKLSGIEALADVTDATNVDAAGAVMNSDTSTAAMSFVIDEDTMASDSATKVPTQQSVKAYVDAATPTPSVTTKTTTYTITTSDDIIVCTSGTFTVTLPTASGATGDIYRVKNAGAGVITLDGNGAETIDGDTTVTLNQYDSFTVVSDGSNWVIV